MFMKGLKSNIIAGIIFVSALGTLFQFLYKWSGNNFFIGFFTSVNESVWEHTKLFFFPMLIYSVYLCKKNGRDYPGIKSAAASGILSGVSFIIVSYYTYSGIAGFHVSFIDISIFYISVILSFLIVYKLALSRKAVNFYTLLLIIDIALICLYVIFTLFPPDIPLFISPDGSSK